MSNPGILGLSAQGVEKGYSHKEDEAERKHHGYDAEREITKNRTNYNR